MSKRPSPADLLKRQGALLTRGDLAALGLTRTMIDSVFRSLDVIYFPGCTRVGAIRREDYLELLAESSYGRNRVRPT